MEYGFAPYNFIPFTEGMKTPEPYQKREELPRHDIVSDGRYSGRIEYEIENLTEMIVGGTSKKQEKQFFKDGQGRYAIPGSTMRGFVRSHAELLSFSYPDMVDDNLYLFRKFADKSKKLREEYAGQIKAEAETPYGLPNGVKAGYIYCTRDKQGKRYYIKPVKEFGSLGTTFFKVHERNLRKAGALSPSQCLYREEIKKFKPQDKRNALREYRERYVREYLKKYKNRNYRPYHGNRIHFDYCDGRLDKLNDSHAPYEGIVMNSAYIEGKTHHYLVSSQLNDSKSPVEISLEHVEAYTRDLTRNAIQNPTLKGDRAKKEKLNPFYSLPEKPVRNENDLKEIKDNGKLFFYKIGSDGKLVGFGSTPYFRIPYLHSAKEGIPYKEPAGYDFARSMFGYAGKQESYRSRISFQNAVWVDGDQSDRERTFLQGEPKGTAVQLYLDQTGKQVENLTSYNDRDFQLRGYKIYWKRENPIEPSDGGKRNMTGKFQMIAPNQHFKGVIYFDNLSGEELGLLLLSIQFQDPAQKKRDETYMLGGAKAYGYGKVKFDQIKLFLYDIKQSYLSPNAVETEKTTEIQTYKEAYKEYLKSNFDIDFDKTDTVRVYRKYSLTDQMDDYLKNHNDTGYMSFKEYAARNPLASAAELLQENVTQSSTTASQRKRKKPEVVWRSSWVASRKQQDKIAGKLGVTSCDLIPMDSQLNILSVGAYKKYDTIILDERAKRDELDVAKQNFKNVYQFKKDELVQLK